MEMKIHVSTSVTEDEKIIQTVETEYENRKDTLIQTIADTKEEQLRSALISLGWTPPKGIER